jgi:hypothetical protein
MNKTSQGNSNIVPRVQELADLVDKLYSRPRYWTSIISIGGFAFLTTIVVIILGQIVIIGSQTDGLSIGDTVTSTIALVALVISISQYIGNTDSVENNEWVADCIKHNQKKIGKQQPNLSMDDKLIQEMNQHQFVMLLIGLEHILLWNGLHSYMSSVMVLPY